MKAKRQRTGSASSSTPAQAKKRSADGPPDDPRGGSWRATEPDELSLEHEVGDDVRESGEVPPPADETGQVETPSVQDQGQFRLQCATCDAKFDTRNQLHKHLIESNHRKIDSGDDAKSRRRFRQRQNRASQVRQAIIDHFGDKVKVNQGDIPVLSMPKIDKDLRNHPGPRVKPSEIKERDFKWVDVGSGIFSRIFTNVTELPVTSKHGPSVTDVHSRRIWNIDDGKLVDDCVIDNTPDNVLNRKTEKPMNIRVELTMKNATEMFLKKGPDVCEIFSQPRVCCEAAAKEYDGVKLQPG